MYPGPTSETIEESRRLELNGPITAAASKPPLPASHNELNDLFHRTHFCHSNPVSHSAPKHNYCHSGSREAKCLLLVIYASISFRVCVCMWRCVCVPFLPGVVVLECVNMNKCLHVSSFSFLSNLILFKGTIDNCNCYVCV